MQGGDYTISIKFSPIMLALCLMLFSTYYAQNYASIIGSGLCLKCVVPDLHIYYNGDMIAVEGSHAHTLIYNVYVQFSNQESTKDDHNYYYYSQGKFMVIMCKYKMYTYIYGESWLMVTQYYMCEGFSIYVHVDDYYDYYLIFGIGPQRINTEGIAMYLYCYGDHGYHAVIIQLNICLCMYSYVHMCLCVLCMHTCMTIVKLTFVDDLIK